MRNTPENINPVCLDDKKIYRADCQHCSIRHRMLFAPLDMNKISHWLWPINHQVFAPKTRLYHQGQPPQSIFSIRRGYIKLIQLTDDGKEHIVRLLGPGSCLGLEALMNESYHQSAEALTEIDFCTIPIKTIFQLEKEQPVLYEELIKQWQHQLSEADNWLSHFFSGTIKQRLCRFLLLQHKLQKLPGQQLFLISNQDIASVLSTTVESVSRCISELRKTAILTRIEKRTYQLDLDAAAAIADS
jgi:CRP-like cAMP-binding protein